MHALTTLPATIRIGVSGHRLFTPDPVVPASERQRVQESGDELIRAAIREVLRRLDRVLSHTSHSYIVLSSLDEGADRFVTREVLAWPGHSDSRRVAGAGLHAILPLAAAEFEETFSSEEARTEFRQLIRIDGDPLIPTRIPASEDQIRAAYEKAGRRIVDQCDVLIVIWDGQPSGGREQTAAMVEYAKDRKQVFHIHQWRQYGPDAYFARYPAAWRQWRLWGKDVRGAGRMMARFYWATRIRVRYRESQSLSAALAIDDYNGAVECGDLEADLARRYEKLHAAADEADLTWADDSTHCIERLLLPWHSRAAHLANYYQTRYMTAGTVLYILAAAAVATACIIRLFFSGYPKFYWIEAAEIAAIVILYATMTRRRWHEKWIDYRFLSERMRAVPFQHIAGLSDISFDTPAYLRLSHLGDNWIAAVFHLICAELPAKISPPNPDFESVKQFVATAWIEDQIGYYRNSSEKLHKLDRNLEGWGATLAFSTLAAAVVHASAFHDNKPLAELLTSVAFIFPAIGGTLAGIRIYREFHRNAERYQHTGRHLEELNKRIRLATGWKELHQFIEEANHLMLREHQGWRLASGVQPPGPG